MSSRPRYERRSYESGWFDGGSPVSALANGWYAWLSGLNAAATEPLSALADGLGIPLLSALLFGLMGSTSPCQLTTNASALAYVVLLDPDGPVGNGSRLWDNGWLPALYRGTEFHSRGAAVHDLRPAFPDNLLQVRQAGRVLHANGLYRHGFLLAPALARRVADAALDAGSQGPEAWVVAAVQALGLPHPGSGNG